MRYFFYILLFCNLAVWGQTKPNMEANIYYQDVLNEQYKIGKEIYLFKQNVTELNLKILVFQIKKSIKIVDSLPAFNNEKSFKTVILNRFKLFLDISENEYKQVLALVEDPDIDNKEYRQKMQAIFAKISAKSKPLDEQFAKEEILFTQKYGLKIE